jgi:hypothetical protein
MAARKTRITHRDAGTGRYVSEDYAKKHPKTTVSETNKISPEKQRSPKKK